MKKQLFTVVNAPKCGGQFLVEKDTTGHIVRASGPVKPGPGYPPSTIRTWLDNDPESESLGKWLSSRKHTIVGNRVYQEQKEETMKTENDRRGEMFSVFLGADRIQKLKVFTARRALENAEGGIDEPTSIAEVIRRAVDEYLESEG